MKQKTVGTVIREIIFAISMVCCCLVMNSDKLPSIFPNHGNAVIMTKSAVICVVMFIATMLNRDNIKYISKAEPIILTVISVLYIFDYYVTKISGSMMLFRIWWLLFIFITEGVVFLIISICNIGTREYEKFYRRFWIAALPLYIFLIIICFVRQPGSSTLTTNFIPGKGTFRMLVAFLHDLTYGFEAPLIFFGNLVAFLPLPFFINTVAKKIKPWQILIAMIPIPFVIEGYQYLFSCGDVDIDDIILNIAGMIIGTILLSVINKKRKMTKVA